MWFCFISFSLQFSLPLFTLDTHTHTQKHTLIHFLYPCCRGNTRLFKAFYPRAHTQHTKDLLHPFSPSLVSWVLHVLNVVTLTPVSACWCHQTSELCDAFYSGACGSCELYFKSSRHMIFCLIFLLRTVPEFLIINRASKKEPKHMLMLLWNWV